MNFPCQFISAGEDFADFNHQVPAPYIRKEFTLSDIPESAELLITGLGFYRVFINGTELTKCILAPYISNPDDIIYYDRYDALPYLTGGSNVIGIILGNGMQNAYGGFVWAFDKARWRGAPMTALRLDILINDGAHIIVESDTTFRTHPSPLLEDELRCGECYDARLGIDNWCSPACSSVEDGPASAFREEDWKPVIRVTPPRGEMRLCKASPIKVYERRRAVSIIPYGDGYLYDFGVDAAGICELRITGTPGQEIRISYAEWYHDGILEKKNLMFPEYDFPYTDRVQDSCYICRGGGEETYMPSFTYYGFRYAYVRGIKEEHAVPELLTYHICGGAFEENGSFSCSDETANQLQAMTRRATLSNFLWFPTDCPHREKNGWTGDAALSAEHMLLNLSVEDSLREWLRNVEAAQAPDGGLPGIVPTGGWGFGNGPAWDQVIVEIPFCLFKLRGDLDTAREVAPYIFRYLFFLSGSRNKRGLVDTCLGDWCETGKSGGGHKAPIEVTDTAISVHLLEEAGLLFRKLGMESEARYARKLREELKKAFRKQLRTAYSTARDNSIQEKLVLFQQSFNNDLDHVFNIHYNLCNNTNLKMLRHSFDSSWYSSLGITDMREFASANPLVSDIIYIQKNGGKVLACKNYIYKSNDEYYFSINHKALKIPVGKYGHDNKNTMVYIKNQELSLLLLFPNVASSKYELFYVIDSDEIIARINNMLSEEISGVYLTDSENNIISASGDYSVPPVYRLTDSYGLQKNDEGDEIIYTVPLHTNLFLTVCFSKDVLLQYASKAFINMYMVFAAIGCTGFVLILFGMRLTYSPLHRLSKKFADRAGDNKGLESQLDFALSSALQEQRKLQEKIEKYHSIMKESVLDTIVNENGEEITAENMDRLFNGEPGSLMFVIKISAPADGEGMTWVTKSFRDFFLGTFPNNDSFCIRLEITPKYCSYLIYYGGQDQDKYNVIKYLLHDFYKEYGCRIALSNGSSSPLDIPNLYANAMQAGNYWDSHPIAFYDEMDIPKDSAYTYPYQELSSFASLLQQLKFEEAKKAIRSFFQTLDQTDFPAFYSRSVLTEVLTTIITNMNQQNIKFSAYNNIYFETLYFIRSFSYEQKSNDIYDHFIMLLSLFEDELSNLTIKSGELQDFINQSYTSKDLTIAMLAEKFHVSIAYMSYLFKKYFNEYFSDYLWKLRVAKAKELLRGTSKPMEEICIAVGYENVSSFRRKFKKELGITPSQYRNGTEPVTEKSRGESQ